MTIPELIFKNAHNMLALAKIRGAVIAAGDSWGVKVGTIEPNGDITLYPSDDLLEIADVQYYKRSVFKDALEILRIDNPEIF